MDKIYPIACGNASLNSQVASDSHIGKDPEAAAGHDSGRTPKAGGFPQPASNRENEDDKYGISINSGSLG